MDPTVRRAAGGDVGELVRLYRELEAEMVALHPMWPLADGLPEPVRSSMEEAVADPSTLVFLGEFDGEALGFVLARVEDLLPQAEGGRVGSIRLVFTELEARGVGVGEVMREAVLDELRERGIRRFDAHVLPGHRLAKNFFEAGGFSARSIVMHRDDDRSR